MSHVTVFFFVFFFAHYIISITLLDHLLHKMILYNCCIYVNLLVLEGPKEDWYYQLGYPLKIKNLLTYLLTYLHFQLAHEVSPYMLGFQTYVFPNIQGFLKYEYNI